MYGKGVKIPILGNFRGSPTGRIEVLPVELRYWSFLAKSDRSDLKSYR